MRSFTNPICGRGWGGRILGGAAKCKQSTSIQSNDYQTRPRGRLSHNLVCVDDSFEVLETPVGIGLSHTLGRIGTVSSRDARRRGGSENGGETDATSLSAGRFGYVYSTGRNSVKTPPYPQKPQSGASDAAPVINDDVMFLWVAFGGGARLDAVAWVQTTLLALASSVSSSTSPQRRGPRPGAGPEDPRSMLENAGEGLQALLYLNVAATYCAIGLALGSGGAEELLIWPWPPSIPAAAARRSMLHPAVGGLGRHPHRHRRRRHRRGGRRLPVVLGVRGVVPVGLIAKVRLNSN